MQLSGHFLSYSHRRMAKQAHDCVPGPWIQSSALVGAVLKAFCNAYHLVFGNPVTFSISVFLLFEVL